MQMSQQNDPSDDLKRVAIADPSHYFTQQIDLANKQIVMMPP